MYWEEPDSTHGIESSAVVASAFVLLALPVSGAVVSIDFVIGGFELTSVFAGLDCESEGGVASVEGAIEIVHFRWR